jgi:8-oxo-dGTP pyrophosphatase MutT (NUDIX family)
MTRKIIDTFLEINNLKGFKQKIPRFSKYSSILVPVLYPLEDWEKNTCHVENWTIVFTLRSSHLKEHAGEISFPGGRIEKHETPLQTALREAKEEINLFTTNIKATISLNDSGTGSGYHIFSFCALMSETEILNFQSSHEVNKLLFLKISTLLKIKSFSETKVLGNVRKKIWHYPIFIQEIGNVDIWGATGNILKDFLVRIQKLSK